MLYTESLLFYKTLYTKTELSLCLFQLPAQLYNTKALEV